MVQQTPRSAEYLRYEAALQHANVRAFLDAIAKAEGTYGRGDNGYNVNVGGGLFNNGYAAHPRNTVQLNPRLRSNAAGRYQFMGYTWDRISRQYGFQDFKPHTQNIAAVALIAERGALNDVINGNIQQAAYKCRQEWASLPGAPYGQRTVSTNSFLDGFKNALASIARGVGNFFSSIFKPAQAAQPQPGQPQPVHPVAVQRQTTTWAMHRVGNDQQPPSPPYPALNTPRDGAPPEFRPVVAQAPTHDLVNRPSQPRTQSNVIMGDSIGASMQMAYPNTKNVAVSGVSIGAAISQFRHLAPGSTADVFLGSNNAGYSAEENKRQVQTFLQAAEQRGVKINNWILPGNYEHRNHTRTDAGLARVADIITQTVREHNQAHPDRAPIQTVVTRDRGIQKDQDGLHLTQQGTMQVRTLIASASHQNTTVTATSRTWTMHTQTPRTTT